MRAIKTTLVVAALLAAMPAFAVVDHLVPEESVLGEGYTSSESQEDLVKAFRDIYGQDVVARMVTIPSFDPEWAVGVRMTVDNSLVLESVLKGTPVTVQARYSIIVLAAAIPLGGSAVKINRCEVVIDASLGKRLTDVWEKMLLQTRYPDPLVGWSGADGVRYHFSNLFMAGQTWSPNGGKTGALVDIGDAMAAYCDGKKASTLTALSADVDDLLKQLAP